MIVAGCDVGSRTSKAVIMKDARVLSSAVFLSRARPEESAREVMGRALKLAGISMEDISHIVGTGYGKEQIHFADEVESEIVCHARGAWWNMPSVRTIIDIGGQDAKAIRIDDKGNVIRYIYNDKCAAGTGRFLEVMAEAMEVNLEEMGELAKQSRERLSISNQCVIFAETEVISLINAGRGVPDIINGLHHAMAKRVASLAMSIGVNQDIVMTGGVAKNCGMFDALSEGLGLPLKAMSNLDPQINGAVGAARIAEEKIIKRGSGGSRQEDATL
jgi:predicted CoA-substrate-specific enzyme activase